MSEKLENNLVYALYVKAGNPTSLDILPDGKGKFRLMLPKRVVARQNPLQPAGDTILSGKIDIPTSFMNLPEV